jgi:hypothetical protein
MSTQKFPFIVRRIKAWADGVFTSIGEHGVHDIRDAKKSADRLQQEFDADCDPVRVYVYKESSLVPVYAGLQMKEGGIYRGQN